MDASATQAPLSDDKSPVLSSGDGKVVAMDTHPNSASPERNPVANNDSGCTADTRPITDPQTEERTAGLGLTDAQASCTRMQDDQVPTNDKRPGDDSRDAPASKKTPTTTDSVRETINDAPPKDEPADQQKRPIPPPFLMAQWRYQNIGF